MSKCDLELDSVELQNNFIEIKLRHGSFPVNLLHIFRTLFLRIPWGGELGGGGGGCFWKGLTLMRTKFCHTFALFKM